MKSVYVASSLHNIERARHVMSIFQSHGIEISYDWTARGQLFDPEELRICGLAEYHAVKRSNLLFLIQPGRNGAHTELGIALGLNIPVVILEEQPVEQKTFYYLDWVRKSNSLDEAINIALELIHGTDH